MIFSLTCIMLLSSLPDISTTLWHSLVISRIRCLGMALLSQPFAVFISCNRVHNEPDLSPRSSLAMMPIAHLTKNKIIFSPIQYASFLLYCPACVIHCGGC